MSQFKKLSHTKWRCQYHIIWTPKYRYKILTGKLAADAEDSIRAFTERLGGDIIELNVQADHVHLLVMIPSKISVFDFVGTVKDRTAIWILNKHRNPKQ